MRDVTHAIEGRNQHRGVDIGFRDETLGKGGLELIRSVPQLKLQGLAAPIERVTQLLRGGLELGRTTSESGRRICSPAGSTFDDSMSNRSLIALSIMIL